MKKILLFAMALLFWAQPIGAVPTIIHATVNPTVDSSGFVTQYIMRLPQAMLSHNHGIAFINGPAGVSPTGCSDDKSVAWTLGVTQDDGNQRITGWYSLNRTDGPQVLTCTWAAGHTFISGALFEFYGLNALDTTCGANGFVPEIDCTTAATTSAGELIIAFATQTDTAATLTGWTPGTGYTQLVWDTLDSSYGIYQIQSAPGAATPLVNMDASRHGLMAAMTFTAAATGTLPTGMFPINMYNVRFKTADTAAVLNFPCRGDENAITIIWNGAAGRLITGTAPGVNVVSSNTTGGTWKQPSPVGTVFGGSGQNQFPYMQNGTCDAGTTITPTYSGGQALDSYAIVISWIGGAATLLDPATPQSATGTDATGNAFTGSTITATNAGWTLAYIGAATGSASQVVGSPGTFIAPQTVPVIDTNPVGENQGAEIKTITASSSYTVTWTPNSVAIGAWADYLIVLDQASSGSGGGAKRLLTLAVGNKQE